MSGTSEYLNGLPRHLRIRRRADFADCYGCGRRYHSGHFLVFILHGGAPGSGTRTGMAVSRKVGNAVVRNRIKRLLREFCRLHRQDLPQEADIVIVAKKHAGKAALGLSGVAAELLPLMRRLTRHAPGCPAQDGQS